MEQSIFESLIMTAQELQEYITQIARATDVGQITLTRAEEILLEVLQDQLIQLEEFATRRQDASAQGEAR